MAATPGDRPRYWFHAKRVGWGWGFPATWQGWTVTAVWLAIVIVGSILIAPGHPAWHALFMLVAAAAMVAVCYAKGEPPRWRWGE